MTSVQIYGAGMAGLLAAQMLRRHDPVVCEAAPGLPDNHGALLRFRSDAVARAVNQTFRKVDVIKGIYDEDTMLSRSYATIADTNRYSYKVTGKVMPRSIMSLAPVVRYIAPDDFIAELGRYCNVMYSYPATFERLATAREQGSPVISTIPMPALMDMLMWPERPEFTALPIWSITGLITSPEVDVYQTIYYPHERDRRYRASITGDRLIVECVKELDQHEKESIASYTLADFGLPSDTLLKGLEVKHQRYGKLAPISERIRREFILWATDNWGVYSVGRFATWRQLLLDDVVNDIQVVDRFITQRDNYTRRING